MAKTLKKVFHYKGHTSMSTESTDFWGKIPKHKRISMIYRTKITTHDPGQYGEDHIHTTITIRYRDKLIECKFCGWAGTKAELKKNEHCPKCQSPSTKNQ